MSDSTISPEVRAAAERAGVAIRSGRLEDLDGWHAIFDDPSVIHGTMQLPFTTLETRRGRWASMLEDQSIACIIAADTATDDVVGSLGLHLNGGRRRHSASLGMGVRADWRGRGVGSALMTAACDMADRWWNLHRMDLEVYTDNAAAIALYQKHGFEIEGTLRDLAFRDGQFVDAHTMARIRA